MTFSLFAGQLLFEIRQLGYLIFIVKVPDYGYLFVSTTILLFLIEIKNVYKIKKIERQLKNLQNKLKDTEK